eukprot:2041318-Rhodomonas_salina.1
MGAVQDSVKVMTGFRVESVSASVKESSLCERGVKSLCASLRSRNCVLECELPCLVCVCKCKCVESLCARSRVFVPACMPQCGRCLHSDRQGLGVS